MAVSLFFLLCLVFFVIALGRDSECEAKSSWADIAAAKVDTATISKNDVAPKPKQQQKQPTTASWSSRAASQSSSSQAKPICGAGFHKQLPADAKQYRVRNVYDGDTLTLIDERRVRLIGIDTPEIAERQPYAQEAKKYTRDYCHKKDIFLSFDPKGDKTDKYGRLVAYVWVAVDGGYLCVNEGIVAAGLATVYLATKEVKPRNFTQMLKLQKAARASGLGIWKNFKDYSVVVSRYGSAFHKPNCRHITNSRGVKTIQASDATDQGLHPCRTCLADK